MARLSDNMRGAGMMVLTMTCFTVNDGFMKALAPHMPLMQAMALRGVALALCLAALCALLGQLRPGLTRRDHSLLALRSLAELGGAIGFLTALFNMPFANVSAIMQVLPLTVTLAGALFFKEILGWRRLMAISVGLIGVLLIVQPGTAGFNAYSLVVLAAVACVTLRDLAARRLSAQVPSVYAALVTAVTVAVGSLIGAAFVDWQPLSPSSWGLMVGATGFLVGGYVFSVAAMRLGDIAAIAPFRYSSLLVAMILGYVFYAERPEPLMLLGAAIVVGAGLYTLAREARLGRR